MKDYGHPQFNVIMQIVHYYDELSKTAFDFANEMHPDSPFQASAVDIAERINKDFEEVLLAAADLSLELFGEDVTLH